MLKDHSYLFALPVNIDFHIRKVYSVIKHLAGRRILHTVKATKQRAFAGTRRPYYNYLFALLYFKVNTLQHGEVAEAFAKINDFYHSSSGSFP